MGKTMVAIGLMSGTSMDGIDVALIETDGEQRLARQHDRFYAYSDGFRAQLREGLADAVSIVARTDRPGRLRLIETYLTDLHAEAVAQFLHDHGLIAEDVAVVGFHGHTVLHAPERRLTVQIGDGEALAGATGIDVVYDLRAADVAAGGQGAPLTPIYHRALAAKLPGRPVAVVNIGGVANVTWIGRNGEIIAFDTGPGNALIDDWVHRHRGLSCDEGGELAAAGRTHDSVLTQYLRHSFFALRPPKSLDRNAFAMELVDGLSVEDGAATLTAFTAASIARSREHFPEAACAVGYLRWGSPQQVADDDDCRTRRGRRGSRRSCWHERGRGRGRSVGLSGRALAQGIADNVSRHDRQFLAHERRCTGKKALKCWTGWVAVCMVMPATSAGLPASWGAARGKRGQERLMASKRAGRATRGWASPSGDLVLD